MTDTERERGRDTGRGRQASCREPDKVLDPWSPGSYSRPKVALNRWATGAALIRDFERRTWIG